MFNRNNRQKLLQLNSILDLARRSGLDVHAVEALAEALVARDVISGMDGGQRLATEIAQLKKQSRDRIESLTTMIVEQGRRRVARAEKTLDDISDSEWDRLVKDAETTG